MVSWMGWIAPRIMPLATDESTSGARLTNEPIEKHRMDPSLLCPERGLKFHPFAPRRQSTQEEAGENLATRDANVAPIVVDYHSESIIMDVYIFPPADDVHNDMDPLHVKMERRPEELVTKTLERMTMSINKQINKKRKLRDKKQKKGNQHHGNATSADGSIFIYRSAETTPWDIQKLTNQQVWTEAIRTPLQVQLQLADETLLALQVDSCPPTILAVQTFEDFATRVFCDVPLVVEVLSLFTTHVVIDWYVNGKLVLADSSAYTPLEGDIGKVVAVCLTPRRKDPATCNCHIGRGYEESYRFQYPVEALPENTVTRLRQGEIWTNRNRRSESSDSALRVVTYNILADQNAYERCSERISFYPYVKLSTLDKARRMPLLLHEILSYQADVICLQEVDESIWRRLFRPVLEHAGYQGYFSSKVAKGMSEGCALLWSLHRFESIPATEMKFYGLSQLIAETLKSKDSTWTSASGIAAAFEQKRDQLNVIENKLGHVVQLVSLPLIKPSKVNATAPDRILVANTHLFFNPCAAHIRLLQMYAICQNCDRIRRETDTTHPIILCGDMNSSLRRAAGYLLIHRQVTSDHSQIREHFNVFAWQKRGVATDANPSGVPEESPTRVEHTEEIQHESKRDWKDFPPVSLPDHFPSFVTGYPEEPEFTHYLDKFAGSLDHIFISQCSADNPHGFTPLRSAPMPSVEDATELVAMPSEKFPSDHVSLVADLAFTNVCQ